MLKISLLQFLALVLAMSLLPMNQAHAASWQMDVHEFIDNGPHFTVSGVFSTPTADVDRGWGVDITSFVGTVNGQAAHLIPLGQDVGYDYDNRFFGPPAPGWTIDDSFDTRGLLLMAGDVYFNLYSGPQLIAIDSAGLEALATGDIQLLPPSAVPEPGTSLLFFLAGCFLCAWRLLRK